MQPGLILPNKLSDQETRATPIAEVVSSSVTGLVAEARQEEGYDGLPEAIRPSFGSFVRAESPEQNLDIVSVVYDVLTGPADSSHKPSALGLTREQLKLEQPHIFALLRTEIQAVTIGFFQDGRFYNRLPPHPAQVHDFLYRCTGDEVRAATADLDFMRLIAGVSSVPSDELIAAAIRAASLARGQEFDFLVKAGQALSHLLRDDYDRLVCLLKKIKPD